jgi:ribonuclease G
MVQVIKEAAGTKGARVTTHYAIPGRWGVYMPNADYIGVSRKIESETERDRLKRLVSGMLTGEEGFIVRTNAVEAEDRSISDDLEFLRSAWSSIMKQAEASAQSAPQLIYSEHGLMYRLARDIIGPKLDELTIDESNAMKAFMPIVETMAPSLLARIKHYTGWTPLFRELGIDHQLDKALARKVWLDNGAYLMIDVTEALTVIDVNTGKYIGQIDLEQTVFEVNMAAAAEIARLLRLRDVGGIIIIDFIDMTSSSNRRSVLESLEQHCRRDRTKTTVVGWTKLGLVEMTRKKVRISRQPRSENH